VRSLLTGACTLVLAACATGAPSAAGPATVPAVPTVVPAGTDAGAPTTCSSPAGYTVALPAGWTTNPDGVLPACSWFAPGPFEVPEASDVRTAPITLEVLPLPFPEAAAPTPDEVARTALTVDGRPAVRVGVLTGPGLYPEGTAITWYAVDLGGQTLVADAVALPGGDHAAEVAALDAMVAGLDLGIVPA
jgi:hypothetical protein